MKWAVVAVIALVGGPMLMVAPILGLLVDPWAPFRLSGQPSAPIGSVVPPATVDPANLAPLRGVVSDAQRYQLARFVGWVGADAITATAISIAEDGSGDPVALSGVNHNGSRDLGLWQINSAWWSQFGGAQVLADPLTNARAAFAIFGRQGWCAWSTFDPTCGPGHTGSYRAFLARAKAASEVQLDSRAA